MLEAWACPSGEHRNSPSDASVNKKGGTRYLGTPFEKIATASLSRHYAQA